MTPRWVPGTYTQPLRDDFISDGPKLRRFVTLFIKTDDGEPLVLDDWQAWLIDHALERYPDDWPVENLRGRLRYRQVLVSMGRQNGKSVLGAVLGFYGLMMHEAGPYVLSLASNADQATIIYNRVKFSIDSSPLLTRRFKTTGTRGVNRLDKPGTYKVKPAKADALQGIPVTMCLFDEVHICPPDMWAAVVLGTAAKDDGMVFGITTAGDDNSTLLKDLYKAGQEAVGGDNERFGFFLWEAAPGSRTDDPEALKDANPALAEGRLDLDRTLSDIRGLPEVDARRYRLNQFVASQSTWLPMGLWAAAAGSEIPEGKVWFSVDRTPSWEHASIVAAVKVNGVIHTEVVALFNKPNVEWLTNVCLMLSKHSHSGFVMDGYVLGDLAKELTNRGLEVRVMRQSDITNACATAYSKFAHEKVTYNNTDGNAAILHQQMPGAVKKNVGDAWRINRQASTSSIDAVLAMVMAIHAAENFKDYGVQVF